MSLTIAIPTYNRNHILLANLRRLAPQLTADCRLLILDNCSDTPVAETLSDFTREVPGIALDVVRNKANVGASANVLRCFELCTTEWLWVLGDDDEVLPQAIATICNYIGLYPDAGFFNFSSDIYFRTDRITTRGVAEFVRRFESFPNILFISSGVYKVAAVTPYLRLGYSAIHSMAPHFAMLLSALGPDGQCCLAPEQIVRWVPPPPHQQWSFLTLGLGVMTLLDLPLSSGVRSELARKIRRGLPRLNYFVIHLIILSRTQKDYHTALYLFDQLSHRLYAYNATLPQRIVLLLSRLMIRFPTATVQLYKLLRGRELADGLAADRFAQYPNQKRQPFSRRPCRRGMRRGT